jgi:hypothetical protein
VTETRAARCELSWLVGDEEVQAVHLAEMFELRRKWPKSYEEATTSRERIISDLLDSGIGWALLGLGFVSKPGVDPGEHWFTITDDPSTEAIRADFAATAALCYEGAQRIAAADEEFGDRDRQDAALTEALSGSGAQLYAGTFAPPPLHDDGEPWWITLGWGSLDEWRAAPPWWQREGYASLAEADADRAQYIEELAQMEAAEAEQAGSGMLRRLAVHLRRELARRKEED